MDGTWRVYANGRRWSGGGLAHQIRVILGTADLTAVGYRLPVLELLRTPDEDRVVGHLGPDLLGPDWNPELALANLLADPARPLGEALLDQRNLAGIGNIYKSELCFLLGATPGSPSAHSPPTARPSSPPSPSDSWKPTANAPSVRPPAPSQPPPRPAPRPTAPQASAPRPLRLRPRTPPLPPLRHPIRTADQGDGSRERPTYWCPTCQVGPAPGTTAPRRTQHRTTN